MSPAANLAIWIQGNVPRTSGELTQLKLQKLLFYCYGAALAFGVEDEIGDVAFEAWRHGPVSPLVFERYRDHGANPLPPPTEEVAFPASVAEPLRDVLSIYSWLDAWRLRQQSHLEAPWIDAERAGGQRTIEKETIRSHFIEKFRSDVRVPEYLGRRSSFQIDRIPTTRFGSLHELAELIRARLG